MSENEDLEDSDANYDLGLAGIKKEDVKSSNWYEKAAENGNKFAQYNLGLFYKNGIGIEKDDFKSFEWFKKSAKLRYKNAQYNIGLCYKNGIGIEKDMVKSFKWFRKSANQGHSDAQNELGICYEDGIGTEKNEVKAFQWYKKAAENNNKDALYKLSLCYEHGTGVEKDKVKAFYWYEKAAENVNKDAFGIEKDECKAFKWYEKSAKQGYSNAQNKLGICYENGIGIEKNELKAFYWYQKAAENNNKNAQFNLSNCYENGIGTKKDVSKAFGLYKELAEQEYCNAQNKLGFFYEIGKGVEKDLEKAIYWFKKAEKGSENATEWIKNALKYEKVKFISFHELKNLRSLCTGGFGHITKAIWIKTNNNVICKRLTNTAKIKHDLLHAFIHELKIHLRLDYSDRIIRCLGISLDPKTSEYFLIMQYANGGDLQNYLKNNFKNLTWNDQKKLAFQIADGLNYLHNENVLHRDLHSKNIVIHESNAKITDFGISKIQNDQNSSVYMGNFGIVAYVEPKRILDPNFPYTKASDIYSLGVLMWEISSGRPPFIKCTSDSDRAALGYAINNGTREVTIPNTPNEYAKLYKSCWDQEPEKRPTIYEVLVEFEKMGFGINAKNKMIEEEFVKDKDLTSELQASNEYAQSSDLCIDSEPLN